MLTTKPTRHGGHIATVPAHSSGTLTNVLAHRNAKPQINDMTPHPVTVYRHEANMLLCYPLMWNVILEYTTTHFIVPMESVSLRLCSDAYPCHRVQTHGLISVI